MTDTPAIPEGWVLVPREPLQQARDLAMRMMVEARIPECGSFGTVAQDLDAMLSAAPKPPAETPVQAPVGMDEAGAMKVLRSICSASNGPGENDEMIAAPHAIAAMLAFAAATQQPVEGDEA